MLKEPTVNVHVNKETLLEIQRAEEPAEALKEAWRNKKITCQVVGFWNKIKFGVISFFDSIFSGSGEEEEVEVKKIEKKEEPKGPKKHIVEMNDQGFDVEKINIKAGDTVVWENTRTGRFNKAMVVGTIKCIKVRSSFFESGESFNWTFEKPETCTIVDGIMTTEMMKVVVEE